VGISKRKKELVEDSEIDTLQNEIESHLFLIGATALEDKL
jgi:hypothetical protein